ncbi:MAG: endonuclease/exonuclease/phosphatase family protein [Phycisphaerales bacterium]|nr:endonuclease/exonuclease/phosphatase family protein [Phycisphaerales bacterium]
MTRLNRSLFASISVAAFILACSAQRAVAYEPKDQAQAAQPFADSQTIAKFEDMRSHMRKFGLKDAPDTAGGAFRLTTYNIENLFDAHDDPALTGRDDDADDTKPEHELIATAMAIRAVNADVLCFQEIESEQALLGYRDTYLSDMGYDHVVSIDAGNSRGIENAVLSRFPITNAQNWPNKKLGGVHPEKYGNSKNWYAGEPIAFRRSPLMVDLQIPGADGEEDWTLTLFVLHHKSGFHNHYWREAEARGTLKLIQSVIETNPERAIVLLGDYNALPEDDSVQIYLDAGFVDIFADRKESPEITTHESGRRIDLILANEHALGRMDTQNAFVYGTTARPEGTSYRDLETFEGYAADHYPVSVDLSH